MFSGRQLQEVIAKDGVLGLFGRGLKTKILANGMQGMLFTVSTRLRQRTSFFRVPRGPCGAASWNSRCNLLQNFPFQHLPVRSDLTI